ncbi:MAG: hypothetical protein U1F52_15790 [Burkholderiales bacterium]
MSRESANSRQMRTRIAQLAARIMAEDGVADFGLAKRKAARQVGAPDTRNLPDNAEIEQAMIEYQQLYRADEYSERLDRLRRDALSLMKLLDRFEPHLVGPALSGSVGRYADFDLHLFADNPKELELFFINRGIPFRARESRYLVGGEARTIPEYEVDFGTTGATLAVFSFDDIRRTIRSSAEGRPIERVKSAWVEEQLAARPMQQTKFQGDPAEM